MKNIIPFGKPIIGPEERRQVINTLNSGILVHGKTSHKFEEDFKKFTKAEDAISVSSCTAGMHLLYFVLGIGPGDEVIVPAQTHLATAHAVELTGAKAVFVDCELETGNIDVNLISKKINSKTKAIAVVHYLGIPVDLSEVLKLTKKK
jgi:dTDP-4-amino-4,6-dideoxygalactose transaminase